MNKYSATASQLRAVVDQILAEECQDDKDLIATVCDTSKRGKPIVAVRERVLKRLRSEIWEEKCNSLGWKFVHQSIKPFHGKWAPMSYPRIAQFIGGNHSTWVKMAQKIQRKEKDSQTIDSK